MCVPCGPRTRFERYTSALNKRGFRRLEERIDAYVPSEPLGRSLRGRLRASSFDFHIFIPVLILFLVRTRDMKIRIRGVVQSVHPGFGMGVQFKPRTAADHDEIQELIDLLASQQALEPGLP